MAKPATTAVPAQTDPAKRIRFVESDVCGGSVWSKHEVMTVTDETRADAELAVKRGTAKWVNDANATGNTTNA